MDAEHPAKKALFDPVINLGHVLTMMTMLGTVILGWTQLSTRLALVEAQVAKQTEMLDRSIRTDERLNSLRERVDRLERPKP